MNLDMNSSGLNEETVEFAALEWLNELGYTTAFGPDIAVLAELHIRSETGVIMACSDQLFFARNLPT